MLILKKMSNSNKPDERVVYLTLKNVFMGNVAEMRKLTAIRKVIQKERKRSDIENLVSAHGLETFAPLLELCFWKAYSHRP